MTDWFADESLWREVFPFEFGDATLAHGEDQVEHVLTLSGVKGGAALDLGCGPGRHAVPLAQRGFRVTAVDLSAFHLEKAKARAAAVGVAVEFVQADMRAFARPGAFDLAISLFTSLGYFEDDRDDQRVLQNLHASLKPGAPLVMDLVSKERIAKDLSPTVSQRAPDGTLRVQRHQITDDWTRVKNESLFIKDDRVRTFTFSLRIYSGQELKALLATAGFARGRSRAAGGRHVSRPEHAGRAVETLRGARQPAEWRSRRAPRCRRDSVS
jgi:SAM-dependent methyltransferase